MTTGRRIIALTFDDGPSPYTPQILSILRVFHAHATFFVIGRQVPLYSGYLREIVRDGNELGNHTQNHLDLRYVSDTRIKQELMQTQQAIRASAGITAVWFHPPDGVIDGRIAADASSVGLRSVLWSVDPRDWSLPGTAAIVQRVLAGVRPGSIILLHDGGGNRSETAAALPIILRTLQAEGYQFLTLSALFGQPAPPPCNQASADTWFASVGITPLSSHAIYKFWLQSYCRGTNFGPATSGEYVLSTGTVAQDFARTAHRLEWDRKTGAIRVTLEWGWAANVFSAREISPQWGTPITHAWFDDYFRGYDHGPALDNPQYQNGIQVQCFQRACASVRAGHVAWQKSAS